MPQREVGDRVGAVMSADGQTVKLFGYGVYAGDFVPPKKAGGFGSILHDIGATNPRIDLDNGKSVYGCECWWGDEEAVKKRFDGFRVEIVDIDEARNP